MIDWPPMFFWSMYACAAVSGSETLWVLNASGNECLLARERPVPRPTDRRLQRTLSGGSSCRVLRITMAICPLAFCRWANGSRFDRVNHSHLFLAMVTQPPSRPRGVHGVAVGRICPLHGRVSGRIQVPCTQPTR